MTEMTPQARALPAWVRYTIDYGGLAAWLLALAVGFAAEKRVAPMPLVTAVLGIIFGGLTLFFHDERFIKVKPTILYTLFGLFLITGALRGKNPLKVLMGDAFHLPYPVVRTLTLRYALFFFALAVANEIIWRTQTTLFWGFFKVPGVPIIIFLFAMTQAPLMMKHMPDEEAEAKPGEGPPTRPEGPG